MVSPPKTPNEADNPKRCAARGSFLAKAVFRVAVVAAVAFGVFGLWGFPFQFAPRSSVVDDKSVFPSAIPDTTTSPERPPDVGRPGNTAARTRPSPASAIAAQASVPETPAEAIEEAKALIGDLVAAFPTMPDALEICARVRLWLGDSDGAAEAWHECLQLSPQYAYAFIGLGGVAAKKGDYEEAIELFQRALELEPKLSEVRRDLARALLDGGQAERAIVVLQEYVAENPQLASGYVLLGFAYQQTGDWKRVKQNYEAALERDLNHTRAVYGLATACARLGQTEESQAHSARFRTLLAAEGKARRDERGSYDDVSALSEDLGRFYTDAGRVYFSDGQLREAERLCRRAAVLCPQQIDCRQALAWICRQQGRLGEAIEVLEDLAKRVENAETYYLEIGRLQIELGRWSDAETAFRRALRRAPDNADCHASLVRLYLRGGLQSTDELVALARDAVRLKPSAENYALLGTVRERAGDEAGAIVAFQRAVELAPEVHEFRRRLESLEGQH